MLQFTKKEVKQIFVVKTFQIKRNLIVHLEGIRGHSLNSYKYKLLNKTIFSYIDSYAYSLITRKGSKTPKLHGLALEINKISSKHCIDLNVCWIQRKENKEADRLSNQVEYDDWFITKDLVKMFTNKWGKISIDRIASNTNKKKIKNLILNTNIQDLRM